LRTSIVTGFFVGLGVALLFVFYWWVARGGERRASADLSRQTQAWRLEEELTDTATGTERWRELKRSLADYEASQKALHAAYATKTRIFAGFLLGVGLGWVIATSALAHAHWVALGVFAALLLGACTGVFGGMVVAIVYQLLVSPMLGWGSQHLRRLHSAPK
jgi:F0F1-type ATP synthase assembly protein I